MNNSNNRPLGWTTLEEAKQLIEAGLPVETADMHYFNYGIDYDSNEFKALTFPYVDTPHKVRSWAIPCWSLGALIKLMPKTISIPVDERSACFYNLEWQFANNNSLRYIATNRGKCLIDVYNDHDIGSKSFIETTVEMIIWLLKNKRI